MYARVTLLEIDTLRTALPQALELFRAHTLERLQQQTGYCGVWVLATPDGKGLLMSLWETRAQAHAEGDHYHYSCLLYTSPSPRDRTRSRMPSSA